MSRQITLATLAAMKQKGEKIVSLTAYDAAFATILEQAGVDVILVGDSLGMVLHGRDDTLGVSMTDMVYHTRLVSDGCKFPLIVSDMPYKSYTTRDQALENAERLVKEGGAEVVKLEGGGPIAGIVQYLRERDIPVCGHLGLTPQSVRELGGYRVQGREKKDAEIILADARLLQEAGAEMLVLECIPHTLAEQITGELTIPVIGIGAGRNCDGQVLVLYDVLGITRRRLKFSRDYLATSQSVLEAIEKYVQEVRSEKFPATEHQFE